jgi:hypothetical protein
LRTRVIHATIPFMQLGSLIRPFRVLFPTTLLLFACGSTEVVASDDAGHACVPGRVVSCPGPSGCSGTQTCNTEGTGYGSCACGAGAPDARSDVSAESGRDAMLEADAVSESSTDSGGDASSGPCGRFKSGYTGTWGTVAPVSITVSWISGYVPPSGTATLYIGDSSTTFQSYNSATDSYATLLSPTYATLGGLAWTTGFTTGMAGYTTQDYLQVYDPSTGAWTAPGMTSAGATQGGQTATDDAGNIWGFQNGSGLLRWPGFSVSSLTTPLMGLGIGVMTFDSCSGLLYIAGIGYPAFYSYDPAGGTQTLLKGLPDGASFSSGFCGDRSGHIFAYSYVPSGPIYQYTIATNSWTTLPAGPMNSGYSFCTVGADGYLYATAPPASTAMNRIKLK